MENTLLNQNFEELCVVCKGRGKHRGYHGDERCDTCDGAGYTTTEVGQRILDLMRHNLKPMLEDAIQRD